jgi:hypothetical protein
VLALKTKQRKWEEENEIYQKEQQAEFLSRLIFKPA